jgi:hypothetical protein
VHGELDAAAQRVDVRPDEVYFAAQRLGEIITDCASILAESDTQANEDNGQDSKHGGSSQRPYALTQNQQQCR